MRNTETPPPPAIEAVLCEVREPIFPWIEREQRRIRECISSVVPEATLELEATDPRVAALLEENPHALRDQFLLAYHHASPNAERNLGDLQRDLAGGAILLRVRNCFWLGGKGRGWRVLAHHWGIHVFAEGIPLLDIRQANDGPWTARLPQDLTETHLSWEKFAGPSADTSDSDPEIPGSARAKKEAASASASAVAACLGAASSTAHRHWMNIARCSTRPSLQAVADTDSRVDPRAALQGLVDSGRVCPEDLYEILLPIPPSPNAEASAKAATESSAGESGHIVRPFLDGDQATDLDANQCADIAEKLHALEVMTREELSRVVSPAQLTDELPAPLLEKRRADDPTLSAMPSGWELPPFQWVAGWRMLQSGSDDADGVVWYQGGLLRLRITLVFVLCMYLVFGPASWIVRQQNWAGVTSHSILGLMASDFFLALAAYLSLVALLNKYPPRHWIWSELKDGGLSPDTSTPLGWIVPWHTRLALLLFPWIVTAAAMLVASWVGFVDLIHTLDLDLWLPVGAVGLVLLLAHGACSFAAHSTADHYVIGLPMLFPGPWWRAAVRKKYTRRMSGLFVMAWSNMRATSVVLRSRIGHLDFTRYYQACLVLRSPSRTVSMRTTFIIYAHESLGTIPDDDNAAGCDLQELACWWRDRHSLPTTGERKLIERRDDLKSVTSHLRHKLTGRLSRPLDLLQRLDSAMDDHPDLGELLCESEQELHGVAERLARDPREFLDDHRAQRLVQRALSGMNSAVNLLGRAESQNVLLTTRSSDQRTAFSLHSLLTDVFGEAGWTHSDAQVVANRESLRTALDQVHDNSMRWGGADPAITVSARRLGEFAYIVVEDRGLPAEDTLPLDPFAEGVSMRDGTGVGLAITRKCFREHGGHCELLENLDEAGLRRNGVTFTGVLPAAAC